MHRIASTSKKFQGQLFWSHFNKSKTEDLALHTQVKILNMMDGLTYATTRPIKLKRNEQTNRNHM